MKKEETKVEEVVEEPKAEEVDKFETLTPEQKDKALALLEKDEKKVDWKKTGKRVGIGLAAAGTIVGSFLFGKSRGKKAGQSAGVTSDTTTAQDTTTV